MAEELSLPFGPWTRLASAQWTGHPLSVYVNAENMVMLTVFDKSEKNINGMLVLLKKPLLVEGKTESFAATQQREITLIEKLSAGRHVKYLLLESTPYYVPYTQADLIKVIQRQYAEISGLTKVLFTASASYDFKVTELHPNDTQTEALLGDPFTLFALSSITPSESVSVPSSRKLSRFFLGIDASGQGVEAGLSDVSKIAVLGGTHPDRLRALAAVCEAALSTGVPCMVFDGSGIFSGLGVLGEKPKDLEKFGLSFPTAAYSFKSYALGQGLLIDLRQLPLAVFESLSGLSNKDIRAVLERIYADASSLEDLIQRAETLPEAKPATQYALRKAARALRCLQTAFPSTFGKNSFSDLSAPWDFGSKVFHVDLRGKDPALAEMVALSMLSPLKNADRSTPSVLAVFDRPANLLTERLQAAVPACVALALPAEHEADLRFSPTLELDLVGPNETVVSMPHRDKKRIQLRPLMTRFAPVSPSPVVPVSPARK
ncbi:hypothetical protein HY994_00775 [Candidatus Micrarchaeota archaeon]|nr:hypothetical protein [Candidatus Micrarchaeota archaeon]